MATLSSQLFVNAPSRLAAKCYSAAAARTIHHPPTPGTSDLYPFGLGDLWNYHHRHRTPLRLGNGRGPAGGADDLLPVNRGGLASSSRAEVRSVRPVGVCACVRAPGRERTKRTGLDRVGG